MKSKIPNTIKLHDGRRVVCRIFDCGPDQWDRYLVAFKARRSLGQLYYPYIASSEHPFHPQGFGQHGENPTFLTGRHLGKRVRFEDVPPDAQKFILQEFS